MTSVEFIYDGSSFSIQCDINDKIKDIINKYITKTLIDKNSIMFLYSGNIVDQDLKLSEMIGNEEANKITILVFSKDNINECKTLEKSKYIICPKCKENIKYKIDEYKINLYECKNGHKVDNILLNEFWNTQYIDISKIICDKCKEKNKSNTYKNEFYKCLECGINICPLCKSSHDKSHNIINYEQKNYICQKHGDIYVKYCKKCKLNICLICENEHKDHNTISYGEIIPNKNLIKEYMEQLRKSIDIFKNKTKEIIDKLNKVIDNIEIYYNINDNIINSFEVRNKNYEILQNMREINNNNIIEEINKINNAININNKITNIINIYNQMFSKDISDINIIYNIKKKKDNGKEEEDFINIFGTEFVNNNRNTCKMIIDNKEYDLEEKFNIKNYNNNILKIRLKSYDITNMSNMFDGCSSLSSLLNNSKWNTNNVTDMSNMFNGCSSLSLLPDFSKWNTNNVTNMSNMFKGCSSLSSLPDISKFNTSNITDMSSMFSGCSSLSSLPDISKWNTNNVKNIKHMFNECLSLLSLPDISKWNTNNITDMSYMFNGCSLLSSLPDFSKWNTNNVTNMSNMFKGCSSLSSLPDISKFNTSKVTDMSYMFCSCSSLSSFT